MNKIKHTPGPWKYKVVKRTKNDTIGIPVVKRSKPLSDIWLVPNEEDHANAKLISAARELLKALKDMVKMYEKIQPSGGYQGVYESAIIAIEKATL